MRSEVICHRIFDGSPVSVRWADQSLVTGDYLTQGGTVSVKHGHLVGGKAEGLEIVLVDTGAVRAVLLPGRGMGIWKLWAGGIEFGWNSPVDGPVHPSLVPVMDPGGLGWLEGFDELVVRCGLESNGAPEMNDSGTLRFPLHGRIANLPARDVRVEVNKQTGTIEIVGDILETRLFFNRLRLRSRIGFQGGSANVEIMDEVTNERSVPATMQMLYHINVGSPVLQPGSRVEVPIATLAPKDSLSASEIDTWNQIGSPQPGYSERVYFATPQADQHAWTSVMLRSADDSAGLGVQFDTSTLPYFIFWKNPAAENDGYVIGLEPATNLPNAKTFEAKQGRVITLAPGEKAAFCVNLKPLIGTGAVRSFADEVDRLSKTATPKILREPKSGWSVTATG